MQNKSLRNGRYDNFLKVPVLTTKGEKLLSDLIPGDQLYEYGTRSLLTVRAVSLPKYETVFKVTYNDGRSQFVGISENVLVGHFKQIHPIHNLINRKYLYNENHIDHYPVDFNINKVVNPLTPDPYISGALLIYGNWDDPYINMPADKQTPVEHLLNKYNLYFANIASSDTLYFALENILNNKPITWKEFFGNYKFYVNSKSYTDPALPNEILYSSINDRRQFIKGVFDVGYDPKEFSDTVGISHWSENRLKEVQAILWSLGVLSKIEYDPTLRKNHQYRLVLLGGDSTYPGFFYDIDNIERVLDNDLLIWNHDAPYTFKIEKIEMDHNTYISNVILDKRNAIYLTADYLPKVSL